MDYLTWLLQILILTLGIYLFLRFLRTTQGNRIVRGLAIAVPLLIIVTWGLAWTLQLEELLHILGSVAGFAVVFIAILFQEELRRGMAQFGANPLVRRFVPSFETDVIEEVCRAALDMATKQETHGSFTRIRPHGALICFQREASLQSYIEGGRRIEARVSHDLLESIFQPKSPLHDGAVVIRKDRVAAASCMLPLTQNLTVAKTMGTRHRAAIGLSEETDAVVLVVSEETGKLSIAAGGTLKGVPQGDLAEELRRALGQTKTEDQPSFGERLKTFIGEDLPWLASSIIIALLMWFIAHQDISITRDFTVHLVQTETGNEPPSAGEVIVVLPEGLRVKSPSQGRAFTVEAQGSRAQIEQLGLSLAGSFTLDESMGPESYVDLDAISWDPNPPFGVSLDWQGDAPLLVTERYGSLTLPLTPDMVPVNAEDLDSYYELGAEGVTFGQSSITLTGPESGLARIESGELPLSFEGITLTGKDHRDRTESLDLVAELEQLSFAIAGEQLIQATVPIVPAPYEIEVQGVPVSLVAITPEGRARLDSWELSASSAVRDVVVKTSGLIPQIDPSIPAWTEQYRAVYQYVEQNLRCLVIVEDQPEGAEPRALEIHHFLLEPDWRDHIEAEGSLDRAGLTVVLRNDEAFLERVTPTDNGG